MSKLLAIKCPSCNAPLKAHDDRPRFFCHFCGTPVVLADALRQQSASEDVRPNEETGPKPAVPIPERLHVEEFGNELTIWWRWFSPTVFFLLPFTIAWNAFLIGWYAMAGEMPGDMPGPMKLIFLVFPIGHVAVGLGLVYTVLVMFVNRTTIRVRNGELTLKHGPVFYPGGRTVPVDEIEQLYCSVEVSTSGKGRPGIKHPLNAQLKSGRTIALLPGNSDADVAAAVEQLVEKHLGIRDRSVAGESRS